MAKWIRQSHRWVSMAFTLTVFANIAALALGQDLPWLYYLPLPPLLLLMASGLYMFMLPHRGKWRGKQISN